MREYTKKSGNQSHALDSNPRASRQAPISDILQAYKNGTLGRQPVQRESVEDEDLLQTKRSGQAPTSVILQRYKESIQKNAPEEDEELLQGKFDTVQHETIDEDKLLQGKFDSTSNTEQELIQREEKPNNTGLPDNLKTGIENLSGYSMDDVKVHYNSDKPAQLQALAYAQGTDIYVDPGQEKHLPHEAWHVVQQKQGRVQPTMQMQGVNVNNNEGLEKEADVIAAIAPTFVMSSADGFKNDYNPSVIQCKWDQYKSEGMFIWDKLRSGLRWYYDQKTNEVFFIIEKQDEVPPDLLLSYQVQEKIHKPYNTWKSDFVTYLDMEESKTNPRRAGFGMELELLTPHGYYSTNTSAGKVPEEKVKAKKIFSIGYGTVDVTFDTRTGYTETSDQDLTVELIFNAKRIPLISDLEALGDTLVHEIREITFESFDKELESTDFKNSVKKTEIGSQQLSQAFIFPPEKDIRLNIHITMAMSLDDIGSIMQHNQLLDSVSPTTKLKQNLKIGVYPRTAIMLTDTKALDNVTNEAFAFIRIINAMFDYNNKLSDDPKQNMNIMNRTSFGKMFSMMDHDTSQSQILNWMQAQIDNREKESWRLTAQSPQTISDFKDYFTKLHNQETTSMQDPTYLANSKEKLGISHLGDKMELDISGVESPIFEFRVGSPNLKLDQIPHYLGELRSLLMNYYSSKSTQHGTE